MDKERGKAQGALKEQRLVTTENFDNEQSDKGRLGIYIQFFFSARRISIMFKHAPGSR